MAISATVTPGKVFQETDVITHTALNQLGSPTVDIAGAVGGLNVEANSLSNSHIQASAGIQLSKLEAGSGDAQIAITNSANSNAYASQSVTGDITITNAGVTSIGDDKVTTSKILDANVTEQKLIAAVVAKLLPPGVITPYVKSGAEPTGWKYCDGQHYDSTDAAYTALYAIIGYSYGRTDSSGADDAAGTYFKVPDLRGRVPVGVDGSAARLAANDTLAATGGAESVTLTSANIPQHNHTASLDSGAVTVSQSTSDRAWMRACWDDGDSFQNKGYKFLSRSTTCGNSITNSDLVAASAQHSLADLLSGSVGTGVTVANAQGNGSGGVDGVNLTQPYQVVEYIIKL